MLTVYLLRKQILTCLLLYLLIVIINNNSQWHIHLNKIIRRKICLT